MTLSADATATGHATKKARAQVRKQLHERQITLVEIVEDPPVCMSRVLLPDLLKMEPWTGVTRINRLGRDASWAGINLFVTVGGMSNRTRGWLVEQLENREAPSSGRSARSRKIHGGSGRAS